MGMGNQRLLVFCLASVLFVSMFASMNFADAQVLPPSPPLLGDYKCYFISGFRGRPMGFRTINCCRRREFIDVNQEKLYSRNIE